MISEVTLKPKNHLRGLINYLTPPSTPSLSLSLYIYIYPFLSSSVSSQKIHTHKVSCYPARFQSVFFFFFILTCSNNWSLRYVYVENIEEVWYCCWPSVFFFFLASRLTTSGSLLFSSTMINSGGFVCLNYRVIHIHSFSLLLLHGLFPFRVRVGPFILVKDLIKIISLCWPMRQHQDSQTLRLELGWYTVTSFTRKVP